MSRSNYDKPFYVDVGTSVAAVRYASNHDVVIRFDHVWRGPGVIGHCERICDRLNREACFRNGEAARWALREIMDRIGYLFARTDGTFNPPAMKEVYQIAEEALKAPSRNCDLHDGATEAEAAFDDFCAKERTGECRPGECPLPCGTGARSCLLAWLFATEGGAK